MDFAKKQLEKYGWTEGKGLGKDENGISEPLKAKKKHSLAGVGYDPAADFTEHWWSTLYNKAANNLEVKNKNGETKKIRRKSKDEFEITNSTWKLKRKKKDQPSEEEYSGHFVKTAIIGQGGETTVRVKESDSESDDEIDIKDTSKLTDDELFAACQGRTAHKGARHGLRALGKLARIEQQEKILLKETKYKGYSHHENLNKEKDKIAPLVKEVILSEEIPVKTKKRKKEKKSNKIEIQRELEQSLDVNNPNNSVNINDNELSDLAKSGLNPAVVDTESEIIVKRKKKRKCKNLIEDNGPVNVNV